MIPRAIRREPLARRYVVLDKLSKFGRDDLLAGGGDVVIADDVTGVRKENPQRQRNVDMGSAEVRLRLIGVEVG